MTHGNARDDPTENGGPWAGPLFIGHTAVWPKRQPEHLLIFCGTQRDPICQQSIHANLMHGCVWSQVMFSVTSKYRVCAEES